MDVASRSRSRVEERLTRLEEEFGAPEVTQTTFEVGAERYQRAIERSRDGQLHVRVVVRNSDGAVLLCEDGEDWVVPSGETRPDERLAEAVRRIVAQAADVDCSVEDVTRANIHGIRNSDDEDAETVYRLSVVFTATTTASGATDSDAVEWRAEPEGVADLV